MVTCLKFIAYIICLNVALFGFLYWNPLNWDTDIMSKSNLKKSSVIVVGGGLAGMSATIEAVRHGAHVTIIDKEAKLGGNSQKATSGINAVGTEAQAALGIEDTVQNFIEDTLASGEGLSDENLVKILAQNSNLAIQFLSSFGLDLTDVIQLGGHNAQRTHRFPPTAEGKPLPVGFTIMSTLRKHVENDLKDSVRVLAQASFRKLIYQGDRVVGLKYETVDGKETDIFGTVVLTAGGYANDHTENSLLVKHVPQLAGYPTTNGPWATGDIIKAVELDGVSLIHMEHVQVHPTGFLDPKAPTFHTKFLAPEALRGYGGLMLNHKGERFVNELGRRDYVTNKIFSECSPFQNIDGNPTVATMLLTQKMIDKFGAHLAGFYIFKGFISKVGSISNAAKSINVSVEVLTNTVIKYNQNAAEGIDEFQKQAFPMTFDVENDVFYVSYITPALHYCMGGIQIDAHAQVIKNESVMQGVYAAGEVTGGVHGFNRLGGNSLLECVVFGRIAGKEAAHYGQ